MKAKLAELVSEQFLRYLVIGFSTVALDFGLFWLLVKVFKVWYLIAQVANGLVVFFYNFLGHRHFTFRRSRTEKRKQLPRYLLLNGWNYFASLAILSLLVEVVGLPPIWAKLVNIAIIVLWNYQILDRFVYR